MDMSFQEKSAWGLLLGIVLVSVFYFPAALNIVEAAPEDAVGAAPLIAISVVGVIALVVIEIVYHAFVASLSRDTDSDERDALIDLKAERNGGFALGIGLFWLVGHIVARSVLQPLGVPGAMEIVIYILLALTVSEIVKLMSQLWYYRVGV
jgi:hypothetical protein